MPLQSVFHGFKAQAKIPQAAKVPEMQTSMARVESGCQYGVIYVGVQQQVLWGLVEEGGIAGRKGGELLLELLTANHFTLPISHTVKRRYT